MIEKIREVIEKQINPGLKVHASGCELIAFDDGVVTLRMFGGCSGCPSSAIALFNGIVPVLKEHVPEIKDVVLA